MTLLLLLGGTLAACSDSDPDDRGGVGGKADEVTPCAEGELTPLGECKAEHCGDTPPEMLQTCVLTNCGAHIQALTPTCVGCVSMNAGKTSEEIAAACAPPKPPAFACQAGELAPLGQCKAEHCADSPPEMLQTCVFTNCGSELSAISQPCLACASEHAGQSSEEIAAACQPPPVTLVCEAGELAPLTQCADVCASAAPEHRLGCLFQNCQDSILSLSRTCLACVDLAGDLAASVESCEVAP